MKCFNCGCEIVDTTLSACTNCSALFNATKSSFISYIGAPNSLAGYQKSYKLLLLKYIIETILDGSEATVSKVISAIMNYYVNRKNLGLEPDYDVDTRISEIENSSEYDVFAVIKSQPFKVINEKGYLFLKHNSSNKLVFVFNEDIVANMSKDEWCKLLNIINDKIALYYGCHDCSSNNSTMNEEVKMENNESNHCTDPSLSVLEIDGLSVRAKNIFMRNKLYTIGAVLEYVKYNDLRSLKNMGQKTFEEIMTLLKSSNPQVKTSALTCNIASLFSDNAYRSFVKFCEKNGKTTLSDLEGFDFSILIDKPGFSSEKVNAIKTKYHILLREMSLNPLNTDVIGVNSSPSINIDLSNVDLDISYLRVAGISSKNNSKFIENGYSKIGDLRNINVGKLVQIFGRMKGLEFFEKIKIFEKSLLTIATEKLDEHKGNREFDIYIERANNKTLQVIADDYGITRERVRQIESKFYREFSPLLTSIVEQYMIRNNLSYITMQEVLDFFDDNAYDTVIVYLLKQSGSLEYLSFADMFVLKKQGDMKSIESKLWKIADELIGDAGISFFDRLPQIEEMLNASGLGFVSAYSFLNYLIEIGAHFYGDFVFLSRQSYARLCMILIGKYYKDGINLYSDDDINKLRMIFHNEFGDYDLPEQNRAIAARLSGFLITCDRGKAKLIENINYDKSVIEDIKNYIDKSPYKKLYFTEIFNEFEGVLAFTSDITNYHGLHGLLVYLYHDEYEFTKDCIVKINGEGTLLSLSERIDLFISNKGRAVTRDEIKQEIRGLSDIMLFNAVNSSNNLLQWDYNCYNSLNNLTIKSNDKDLLSEILEDVFFHFMGYCSDGLAFEKVKKHYPEFISINGISTPTNLFYVLQSILSNSYRFSRPHICKNSFIDPINTKNVALHLLGETNRISRRDFIKISKDVHWSETTADLLFYELEKDYIRVSEDIYVISSDFDIKEDLLSEVADWLNTYVSTQGFLSMIGLNDFENLPSVEYEWNTFLLVSIIKKYGLGFRLVSPVMKDRRYNKEIIVPKESSYNRLDDIVYDLLSKNGINFIDESNLLSFLVINHLVSKVIPKELLDSKILNYSEGYFKIT